ncbi:hypothetical protein VPNG_10357 [Cytospora leucostoma]|uniref:Uncharacterized protein n=1 Tax=Cytospora leucostoma TaxID=1230097 RepID=A0A423VC90_9PEZI|nr:hypothetical protein VPNG_10357 [Cytospora leucostoma]
MWPTWHTANVFSSPEGVFLNSVNWRPALRSPGGQNQNTVAQVHGPFHPEREQKGCTKKTQNLDNGLVLLVSPAQVSPPARTSKPRLLSRESANPADASGTRITSSHGEVQAGNNHQEGHTCSRPEPVPKPEGFLDLIRDLDLRNPRQRGLFCYSSRCFAPQHIPLFVDHQNGIQYLAALSFHHLPNTVSNCIPPASSSIFRLQDAQARPGAGSGSGSGDSINAEYDGDVPPLPQLICSFGALVVKAWDGGPEQRTSHHQQQQQPRYNDDPLSGCLRTDYMLAVDALHPQLPVWALCLNLPPQKQVLDEVSRQLVTDFGEDEIEAGDFEDLLERRCDIYLGRDGPFQRLI